MSGVSGPTGPNYGTPSYSAAGSTGLIGADGKPRQGWGLVDAPEVKPTDPGKLVEAPKFGDMEVPEPKPGIPAEIKPNTEEIAPTTSVPGPSQTDEVKYTEPPPPPKVERTLEVAGSGMGADKKYKMTESEALAVYTILRDHKGNMSVEEMARALKEKYGIDAEVTTIDGKKAVVNKATGNAIAVDTNGNGSLDMSDMKLKEALLAAGIDPDWKANPKVFDLATRVVSEAIEASEKRRKEAEAEYQKAREARVATTGGQAGTRADTGAPGATVKPTADPAPAVAPAPGGTATAGSAGTAGTGTTGSTGTR